MHRLVCRARFNIFLPNNPCRRGRTGRVTVIEWRTHQEHSYCDLLVQKNFCHCQFMVFGRRKYHGPRGLSQRLLISLRYEQHYQHEVSRVNLGLKNPEIEGLLTRWHHGMLSRMVARIITLGTQNMARLLGDSLKHLGS